MKHFLMYLFFFFSFELFAMENYSVGTIYRISEKKQGLNSYVRLLVASYFQVKTSLLSHETETTYLLKKDDRMVTKCRNWIALSSNVNLWLDVINFENLSPAFQNVLQEQTRRLKTYTRPPNNKKLSIIVSELLSWTEGIALLRKVYGKGDGRNVDIKTLEDSLFLIFLRILSPGFWDYPLSWASESSRKKRYVDEQFFTNCMESAITKYMEKVEKYDGPDPLGECEKRYCSDFSTSYKEKVD